MSKKKADKRRRIMAYVLLSLGAMLFLFPFIWMVSTSLKSMNDIYRPGINIFFKDPQWSNYVEAINTFPFLTYLKNTVLVTVLSIIGAIISCSLVAYGFAKIKAPGSSILFVIMLATMMLPGQVRIVPLFIFFRNIGWIDTLYPLFIQSFFANAFFVFLLRQFYMRLPNNLSEAARMDGCNAFQIWYKIYMPLSKPALISVAIFEFMGKWNDFFDPLIYINSDKYKTLALGLMSFQNQYATKLNLLMAADIVIIIPCIILFFIAQRYFIEGVTFTGGK
ncbi:carbohydrate ABC transporter permease [Vallitalea pronyensis]|uniref:Carbohydrate ABC transporter permease n=1 Tax=Vallitalea pronyensis TaxID=1348613 RepID=A0A8J8MIF3_9FIRM|nr:carbohydrate ABC transporter permease [Vallitalea pronyensis]QUI22174.1 carbohydrate ABC transporter permease [Vallitalea pronyensis]